MKEIVGFILRSIVWVKCRLCGRPTTIRLFGSLLQIILDNILRLLFFFLAPPLKSRLKERRKSHLASMASAATFPKLLFGPRCHSHFQSKVIDPIHIHIKIGDACKCPMPIRGLLISTGRSLRHPFLPVSAVGSGRDASIAEDEKKSGLSLENFKTSVVSRDDEKINVRVDLPGKATQKVFDEALTSLARDAPPVPGFRRSKGGKTSNIPSSILLAMLGKSRVTKFVLQEILSVTVGDFVKKENLKVNPEIKTTQSEGDLESSFTPGSSFGFNVILQLEKESDSDEASEEEPS